MPWLQSLYWVQSDFDAIHPNEKNNVKVVSDFHSGYDNIIGVKIVPIALWTGMSWAGIYF